MEPDDSPTEQIVGGSHPVEEQHALQSGQLFTVSEMGNHIVTLTSNVRVLERGMQGIQHSLDMLQESMHTTPNRQQQLAEHGADAHMHEAAAGAGGGDVLVNPADRLAACPNWCKDSQAWEYLLLHDFLEPVSDVPQGEVFPNGPLQGRPIPPDPLNKPVEGLEEGHRKRLRIFTRRWKELYAPNATWPDIRPCTGYSDFSDSGDDTPEGELDPKGEQVHTHTHNKTAHPTTDYDAMTSKELDAFRKTLKMPPCYDHSTSDMKVVDWIASWENWFELAMWNQSRWVAIASTYIKGSTADAWRVHKMSLGHAATWVHFCAFLQDIAGQRLLPEAAREQLPTIKQIGKLHHVNDFAAAFQQCMARITPDLMPDVHTLVLLVRDAVTPALKAKLFPKVDGGTYHDFKQFLNLVIRHGQELELNTNNPTVNPIVQANQHKRGAPGQGPSNAPAKRGRGAYHQALIGRPHRSAAEEQWLYDTDRCRVCGNTGHWANECHTKDPEASMARQLGKMPMRYQSPRAAQGGRGGGPGRDGGHRGGYRGGYRGGRGSGRGSGKPSPNGQVSPPEN